jgi:protein ImuB
MQWLALYFPKLSLQAATSASVAQSPVVLVESIKGRATVIDLNPAAHALHIKSGQSLAAARAIAANVVVFQRDLLAEKSLLQTVASAAYCFSHQICLASPDMICLEVGASLSIFGSLKNVIAKLAQSIAPLNLLTQMGVSPTLSGACVLARAAAPDRAKVAKAWPQSLQRISLVHSALPESVKSALAGVGVREFGALLDLAKSSLARRYGRDTVKYMELLTGEKSDPREWWTPPLEFVRMFELSHEVTSTQALRFPVRRLLQELAVFLTARDGGVQRFTLILRHQESIADTQEIIGLLQPARDAETLIRLCEARLDRMQLLAPVRYIGIRALELPPLSAHTEDLFSNAAKANLPLPKLLERLHSRLGEQTIVRVSAQADHRPERASTAKSFLAKTTGEKSNAASRVVAARPIWLLPHPQAISAKLLTVESGPERIESGWWDYDAVRDYYVAIHQDGRRLWVYTSRRDKETWWLHGVFA